MDLLSITQGSRVDVLTNVPICIELVEIAEEPIVVPVDKVIIIVMIMSEKKNVIEHCGNLKIIY